MPVPKRRGGVEGLRMRQLDAEDLGDAGRLERASEAVDLARVLQRIPERIGAAGPAPVRLDEPRDQPLELAVFLERRIDEDEAALLLGRHVRAERQPAVERDDAHLDVAGEQRAECCASSGCSSTALSRSCGRSSLRTSSGEPG